MYFDKFLFLIFFPPSELFDFEAANPGAEPHTARLWHKAVALHMPSLLRTIRPKQTRREAYVEQYVCSKEEPWRPFGVAFLPS